MLAVCIIGRPPRASFPCMVSCFFLRNLPVFFFMVVLRIQYVLLPESGVTLYYWPQLGPSMQMLLGHSNNSDRVVQIGFVLLREHKVVVYKVCTTYYPCMQSRITICSLSVWLYIVVVALRVLALAPVVYSHFLNFCVWLVASAWRWRWHPIIHYKMLCA